MPLNLAEIGKEYIVHRVAGREKEKHHLENLGIIAGSRLELLSEFHGYYIVRVKDSKIGLDKKLAQKIILIV